MDVSAVRFIAVGGSGVGLRFAVRRTPIAGETVLADDVRIISGGKASNQAIGAAFLGAMSHLVTAVGDDVFAGIARELWGRHGVRVDDVIVDADASTMVGTVVIDAVGENRIIIAPGALGRLTAASVEAHANVIGRAHVCLVSLEIPVDPALAALRIARAAGTLAILNPAPAPSDMAIVRELLSAADWVTPNESEACALTGTEGSPESMAAALRAAGARRVALTLGEDGVLLLDDDGTRLIPAKPVSTMVDTSGAGDAFNTAFALGLAIGRSPSDAAILGAEAGARICEGPGFVEALEAWEGFKKAFV